jgi:putative ABC transport system substrate-binding protein
MIRRRRACATVAALLAAPRIEAQTHDVPRVVFLALARSGVIAANLELLRDGLRSSGLAQGRTVTVEALYADGDPARAETLLANALQRRVDVFVASGPAAARLILRAAPVTPIVAVGLHPRGGQTDLFASLSRPGGTVTGISTFGEQLAAKRVQLLIEVVPKLSRVGVVHTATDPLFRRWGEETEQEVKAQGLTATRLGLASPDPEAAAARIRNARAEGVQALVIVRDFLTLALRDPIVRAAREAGIATIGDERLWPEAGALMSYGANTREVYRLAAGYVVRILAGAKPAELPIEQVTRFELVLNLRTATALGLKLPRTLLLLADEMIE